MKKIWKWLKGHPKTSIAGALFLLFILYMIFAPSPPSYSYQSEAVTNGEVMRKVSASGKVRAINITNVGSEISGQVTHVYVDFNSQVSKGQLLAQIDDTRPRARVTQARAQVDLARASLLQAEAAITRARTDVSVQSKEFERRKSLEARGFISRASIEQAENLLAQAKASLSTALAQAQSARAQISQSSAELESAELDLSRTRIIAPTSGIVINKLVEPGATVAASFQTPNLFEIAADTSRMQVEASVDEADIGQVKIGQQVSFTVDSYPDEVFRARVEQVRQSASEAQNAVSYLVILDVDNRDGKLLTGMTANVDIVTGSKKNVLRVPAAATRFVPRPEDRPEEKDESKNKDSKKPEPKANEKTVWVVGADPYKPTSRKIRTGLQGEDYFEVLSGLKKGEKVITRSIEAEDAAQSAGGS